MQVGAWLHVNLALGSEFNDSDVCKPFVKNLTLTLYKTVLFIQGDDYLSDFFLLQYADPVADLLDKWGVFRSRLFRESCVFHRGNYVKVRKRVAMNFYLAMSVNKIFGNADTVKALCKLKCLNKKKRSLHIYLIIS